MFSRKGSAASRQAKLPRRCDGRIIVHFDYDCFYAACFEVERPELSSLPLAVQQKQIIVTCNYEARKRGLYKLQLITEARKACPEVIIVLGEDLTRFRNHSKDNYFFLKRHIWSGRAERLGFDEVWLDVTDMVDYNLPLISPTQLQSAWFCLSRDDPTQGFSFDASKPVGDTFPKEGPEPSSSFPVQTSELDLRLTLGSHLAFYLRKQLEEQKGFTATVGISTNKVLSKLAGNLHKPRGQTTLLPPYETADTEDEAIPSNVQGFLDSHEIGQIPGIGHKGSQQIRSLVKGRNVGYHEGLVTHNVKEKVTVREARLVAGIGPELLEATLSGPGAPRGIGGRTWELLHGIDDTQVAEARDIPRQISIEDTYLHMHDLKAVRQQLVQLSASLIKRLRLDLTGPEGGDEAEMGQDLDNGGVGAGRARDYDSLLPEDHTTETDTSSNLPLVAPTTPGSALTSSILPVDGSSLGLPTLTTQPPTIRWLAHPRTLRLSTRERKPQRSFARVSRSGPMPSFVFSLTAAIDQLAAKLADEHLLPMFTKLIPGRSAGFDINLINIAATNMAETAGERTGAVGRDIAGMFRNQEKVLREWRVEDRDVPPDWEVERVADAGLEPENGVQEEGVRMRDERESASSKILPSAAQHGGDKRILPLGSSDHALRADQPRHMSQVPSPSGLAVSQPVQQGGSEDGIVLTQSSAGDELEMEAEWESDGDEGTSLGEPCSICGALMPSFAMEAHMRYHREPD